VGHELEVALVTEDGKVGLTEADVVQDFLELELGLLLLVPRDVEPEFVPVVHLELAFDALVFALLGQDVIARTCHAVEQLVHEFGVEDVDVLVFLQLFERIRVLDEAREFLEFFAVVELELCLVQPLVLEGGVGGEELLELLLARHLQGGQTEERGLLVHPGLGFHQEWFHRLAQLADKDGQKDRDY